MQVRNLSTTVLTLRKHGRKFLLQPGKVTTIPEVLFTKEQVKAIYGNFVQILNDDLKVVDTPSEDVKGTHKEAKVEKVEAPEETTEVVEEATETPVEEVAEEAAEETGTVAEEATEEQTEEVEEEAVKAEAEMEELLKEDKKPAKKPAAKKATKKNTKKAK